MTVAPRHPYKLSSDWDGTYHRKPTYQPIYLSTHPLIFLAIAIADFELMSQMNQFHKHAVPSFTGDKSPYAAFSGTPDRSLSNSPCSSNTTLVDDEGQTHRLEYSQLGQKSVKGTVSGIQTYRIQAAQSIKSELNPNATTFVPDRFVEYGYFPPPINTPEAWLHILDIGMLASDPTLPPLLVRLGPWSIDTLRDLARLFCWEILAKANIVDFGPEAALFVRDVRDTLTIHHSEWHSSCFVSHLQKSAIDHFKSFWCSFVRSITVHSYGTHHRTG